MKQKVMFLGTRPVGRRCLEILLAHASALDYQIVEVVTKLPENRYLAQGADVGAVGGAAGIPVRTEFDQSGPVVNGIISVQHESVLSPAQLARASDWAINLHMAPLPDYRGAGQFTFAILNQERQFGTTLHLMEPRVDAGPILAQRHFAIGPDWTVQNLYEKTAEESTILFSENLAAMVRGELTPRSQADFHRESPWRFYKRSEIQNHKQIDPAWPLEQIDRTVRAFDMPGFEPAYIQYGQRRLYLRTRDFSIGQTPPHVEKADR